MADQPSLTFPVRRNVHVVTRGGRVFLEVRHAGTGEIICGLDMDTGEADELAGQLTHAVADVVRGGWAA